MARIDRTDGCWRWHGYHSDQGYAQVRVGPRPGRLFRVHRLTYQLLIGEIPAGRELDHLCANRWCVNPDHLEPVTHRENILRGTSVAARRAAQTHCKRGHPFDAANTYVTPSGFRNCRRCRADAERERQARLRGN